MNAKNRIKANVEASRDGFGVYSERLPGVTGFGPTVSAARDEFESHIKAVYGVEGALNIAYAYDIKSILAHFEINAAAFAQRVNISPSLLRRYKGGFAAAGPAQRKKIEKGLHDLGRELLKVQLT